MLPDRWTQQYQRPTHQNLLQSSFYFPFGKLNVNDCSNHESFISAHPDHTNPNNVRASTLCVLKKKPALLNLPTRDCCIDKKQILISLMPLSIKVCLVQQSARPWQIQTCAYRKKNQGLSFLSSKICMPSFRHF